MKLFVTEKYNYIGVSENVRICLKMAVTPQRLIQYSCENPRMKVESLYFNHSSIAFFLSFCFESTVVMHKGSKKGVSLSKYLQYVLTAVTFQFKVVLASVGVCLTYHQKIKIKRAELKFKFDVMLHVYGPLQQVKSDKL